MSIIITSRDNQANGAFAGGLILENKPIGFPQDGEGQKPYSNLFYWANAWSDKGGLIPEHPHKMFEIMSFVIKGEIQHYDSKYNRWLSLKEGDAQIIRAGNGIVHAERLMENSRMFQIWFDPNIQETIAHPATYDDYKSEDIKIIKEGNVSFKNYIGKGGPIQMYSEAVEINELTISPGNTELNLNTDKIYSYYLINEEAMLEGNKIVKDDFIKVEDTNKLNIINNVEINLFEIATPKKLSYKTYSELVKF